MRLSCSVLTRWQKKVGAAVKKAETTEKAKLNADKQRVKTDLAKGQGEGK